MKNLILPYFDNYEQKNLTEIFPDFDAAIVKFISDSPIKVTEYQDEQRFIKAANDNFSIKLRKPFKKAFLSISNFPISAGNTFSKVFKKPLKEKKRWKRIVLLQKLRKYHFDYNLSSNILSLNRRFFEIRSSTAKTLWQLFESLDGNINQIIFPSNGNDSKENVDTPSISLKIKELTISINSI